MARRDLNVLVPRTVTLIAPRSDPRFKQRGLTLSHFQDDHGYVLLGEPGMGKSTAFGTEAQREQAPKPISARRFIGRKRFGRQGEPLFIDGLDEMRAVGGDPRKPLDKILDRLEELGNPWFRLSCRLSSWLVPGDQRELSTLAGSDSLPILELNPLDHDGVRQIVARMELDPRSFITDAFEHRLDSFLWNPLLLGLLCKAVKERGWPKSPSEAFEKACKALAQEHNSEQKDARRGTALPSHTDILTAAGKLSALMLIAGKEGWNEADSSDSEILSLNEVESNNRDALLAALESGLFRGVSCCRVPAHRLLAEYLGARYLDQRIRVPDGVTTRRMLSLLVGHDGIPLPDLRGLSAWLAANNPQARKVLIRADPVAVAFEGDASNFRFEERKELFEELEKRIEFKHAWPSEAATGALAGTRDRSVVWKLTASSERSDSRQHLVYHLLRGIAHALRRNREDNGVTSTANLGRDVKALLTIVRDATWSDDVRCRAIDTLYCTFAGSATPFKTLGVLADDIVHEHLTDAKNKLLGTLLGHLYPCAVSPSNIWEFLSVNPFPYQHSEYHRFWKGLVQQSNKEQIGALIESLCDRASEVIPKLADHGLRGIVLELLSRTLALYGDESDVSDVFRWFELVEYDGEFSQLVPTDTRSSRDGSLGSAAEEAIQAWLRDHRRIQYELVELGLRATQAKIGHRLLNVTVGRKFVSKKAPAEFRRWCLARAVELAESQPKIAKELAGWAIRAEEGWGERLSDDEVARAASGTPALQEWNTRRLKAKEQDKLGEAEWQQRRAEFQQRARERQQEEIAVVQKHAAKLQAGHCPSALLHELAWDYLDGLVQEGAPDGGVDRLTSRLGGNVSLVEKVLAGFRGLLKRSDLPDLSQIAELHERSRQSLFAIPFLAGIEEDERAKSDPLKCLDSEGRRRALGFYFVSVLPKKLNPPHSPFTVAQRARPPWFLRALTSYPSAVADAMVAVHDARIRSKMPPDQHIHDLCSDPAYRRTAVLAVPRMFSVIPTRSTGSQVEALRIVLRAALEPSTMPIDNLRKLALDRLRRKGMDIQQRAQWLCTGLILAKDQCLPAWEDYLATGGIVRARHVVEALASNNRRQSKQPSFEKWHANELAKLIQTLGSRMERFVLPEEASILGADQDAQRKFESLLTEWIEVLAERTDDQATKVLESLAADPDLEAWRFLTVRAQEAQAKKRRAERHEDLYVEQIQQALQGGMPSSAADLAALVLDTLEELARGIRDGSTNDWHEYWDWDRDGNRRKLVKPKHENDCRNRLLSDLKKELKRYQVDAQPEPQYAGDKRADIRVAFGSRLAIPIEIKKASHRDIWRAAEEQLANMYARDPQSGGYGIYVVFWFGSSPEDVPPPRGRKPRTPVALKKLLEEQLSIELRAKISIVVIDVSPSAKYSGGMEDGP